MAAQVKFDANIERKCKTCAGKCWDSNQSIRQENARKFFNGEAIPNACVDSEMDGPKCPYRP